MYNYYYMNLYAVPGLIYAVVCLIITAIVLKFNARKSVSRVFAFCMLTIVVWSITESARKFFMPPTVGYEMFWYHDYAVWFAKIMSVSVGFMLAGFYHFSTIFPKMKKIKYRLIIAYTAVIGYSFIILPTNLFIADVKPMHEGYGIVYGSLILPTIFLIVIYCAFILYNLLKSHMDSKSTIERTQIKLVFAGFLLTAIIGLITLSLIAIGIGIPNGMPESTFLLPMVVFICYAIIKYQLFDIELLIRNSIISFTTAFFVAGTCVSITGCAIVLFPEIEMSTFSTFMLVVMLGVVFAYTSIRNTVTGIIEAMFPKLKWEECKLEEAFLINTSGLVIAHTERRGKTDAIDVDIVGGMLTAVQDFIKDCFRAEDKETLRSLSMGKIKMLVEHSSNAYIVVIFTGHGYEELRYDVKSTLKNIEKNYGRTLIEWNGDKSKITALKTQLDKLFPQNIITV